MNKYLAEFLGTGFFVYVILATGNPIAIGAALALAILLSMNISRLRFSFISCLELDLIRENKKISQKNWKLDSKK